LVGLNREYTANPIVVRERLYREAVERAIGTAGNVRWVPPPTGGKYNGFRISLTPLWAGPPSTPVPAAATSSPTYNSNTNVPANPLDQNIPYDEDYPPPGK